jgi:FtsZ-interacting cell division protein YlmF
MENQKKEFIECECGTHLLEVTSDVEYFNDNKQVRQEFWLAMYSYGTYNKKPSFFERLKIICNYLKTGKMHADQIILHPDEAQKLMDFINENIVPTEK